MARDAEGGFKLEFGRVEVAVGRPNVRKSPLENPSMIFLELGLGSEIESEHEGPSLKNTEA